MVTRIYDNAGSNTGGYDPYSSVGPNGDVSVAPMAQYIQPMSPMIYSTPSPYSGGGGYPDPTSYQNPAQQNSPTYGMGNAQSGGYPGNAPIPQPQTNPVMSQPDWLNSDQTYQNQMTQLNGALADFLKRLATQRSDFQQDYSTASQGLGRNEQQGLLGLGEDMTARGLGNSGLFAQQRGLMQQNFQNQRNALDLSRNRANSDFDMQQSDKQNSTSQALANAQQESLSRRAASMMF